MKDKTAIRLAVRAYDDYQRSRIALGNRIKIKKDGSDQVVPEQQSWAMTERDRELFRAIYMHQIEQEQAIRKYLQKKLLEYPVWTEYLVGLRGVGEVMGAVIISEYDIEIATTVSKLWQFTGLNPGVVRGKKNETATDGSRIIVVTDEYVRGDRLTKGFIAPFNRRLRTKIVGVLAGNLIKQNPHYYELYVNERMRLSHRDIATSGKTIEQYYVSGDGKIKWKPNQGHIHAMARRKMIKIFLLDLYVAWRTIEGLPVRPPYQEEYLGHIHEGTKAESNTKEQSETASGEIPEKREWAESVNDREVS